MPINHGIIQIRSGFPEAQTGHALATAILIELLCRENEMDCKRSAEGFKIDLFSRDYSGREMLVQVGIDRSNAQTVKCCYVKSSMQRSAVSPCTCGGTFWTSCHHTCQPMCAGYRLSRGCAP